MFNKCVFCKYNHLFPDLNCNFFPLVSKTQLPILKSSLIMHLICYDIIFSVNPVLIKLMHFIMFYCVVLKISLKYWKCDWYFLIILDGPRLLTKCIYILQCFLFQISDHHDYYTSKIISDPEGAYWNELENHTRHILSNDHRRKYSVIFKWYGVLP